MSNLVSAADFKAITPVDVSDVNLDNIIARVEAEVTASLGAPYTASLEITETLNGGQADLYLKRPVDSIVSVTEYDSYIASEATGTALTSGEDFTLWADQGRLTRINDRSSWDAYAVIVYTPRDDRNARKGVIIDLTRLTLARQAYRSESVGGEFSYTAPPDWEAERRRIMRRIMFTHL